MSISERYIRVNKGNYKSKEIYFFVLKSYYNVLLILFGKFDQEFEYLFGMIFFEVIQFINNEN